MKYMRRTAGYAWTDYKTNAQIAKELKITPIFDKLLEFLMCAPRKVSLPNQYLVKTVPFIARRIVQVETKITYFNRT